MVYAAVVVSDVVCRLAGWLLVFRRNIRARRASHTRSVSQQGQALTGREFEICRRLHAKTVTLARSSLVSSTAMDMIDQSLR